MPTKPRTGPSSIHGTTLSFFQTGYDDAEKAESLSHRPEDRER
jgi:hypothetical protein